MECLCCAKHCYKHHIYNLIYASWKLCEVGTIISDILKIIKQKLSEVKWMVSSL